MSTQMITNLKNNTIMVIDIGSNSIRSQTATCSGGSICFSRKKVYTTRLAEGLNETGNLSETAMSRTLQAFGNINAQALSENLPVFCYATSAVRDARNGNSFMDTLSDSFACSTEIIDGEKEAILARLGAGIENGGLIDIGGGSFQISTPDFATSFPLGCVRAKDLCNGHETLSSLESHLMPILSEYLSSLPPVPDFSWKAVGGSATTLACMLERFCGNYDPNTVTSAAASPQEIIELLHAIERIPLENRYSFPLLKTRADVILGGGYILYILLDRLNIRAISFSDKDGLEGYATHLFRNAGFLN